MAFRRLTTLAVGATLLATACSPATEQQPDTTAAASTTTQPAPSSTTTTEAPQPVLDPAGSYAVVAFHNHLPAYGVTADGAPDRPWARLHTTRDYVTMTRLIAQSDVKVVLGYSPALLTAITEAVRGNWDHAAVLSATPATELTPEDKVYIDQVFFTASPDQIERFPRYRELADKRTAGRAFTTAEYRDLQALFNLAWTSPLLLEEEPLLSLVAKGRSFTDADVRTILDTHLAIIGEFLESLVALVAAGKVELATTPLYNPTLPLLIRNRMDQDASDQITTGVARARAALGVQPTGLIPYNGLIDQANETDITAAGIQWAIVSGPSDTTPIQLTAESGDLLAITAAGEFAGDVARNYFALPANSAALDAVRDVAAAVGGVPGGVIAISADGTEPWGRYPDSGVEFLESLFRQLADATGFDTALPSELIAALVFDPGPFPPLPDSYLQEADELAAWAYLGETRRELLRARAVGAVTEDDLQEAYELVLQTEDAAWYWWYGAERSSGDDAYYDRLFRGKLAAAWEMLGGTAPRWSQAPLHPPVAVVPSRANQPTATAIAVDNSISEAEWATAGLYDETGSELIRRVFYSFDEERLFLRVDFTTEVLGDSAPGFDLYLGGPDAAGDGLTPSGRALDFEADRVLRWRGTNPVRVSTIVAYPGPATSDSNVEAGFNGNSVEFAVDLAAIDPEIRPGDAIDFRFIDVSGGPEAGAFPAAGRGRFELPNLEAGTELARIVDQVRDDYGPGGYSYLVDSEVPDGAYDLAGLIVRQLGGPTDADPDAASQVQFEITFRQPMSNPWSAPHGFSHQTVDLYLEAYPGTRNGARRLLPGRIAAAADDAGWDYAFTLDGWGAKHYLADAAGNVTEIEAELEHAVLSDRRTILVTVDRAILPPGDETIWQYGIAILANQAIPSLGVHDLRRLATVPGRFQLGGGTGASNDTRLIDVLHPDAGVQEESLAYPEAVITEQPELIGVDRLGRLPLVAG